MNSERKRKYFIKYPLLFFILVGVIAELYILAQCLSEECWFYIPGTTALTIILPATLFFVLLPKLLLPKNISPNEVGTITNLSLFTVYASIILTTAIAILYVIEGVFGGRGSFLFLMLSLMVALAILLISSVIVNRTQLRTRVATVGLSSFVIGMFLFTFLIPNSLPSTFVSKWAMFSSGNFRQDPLNSEVVTCDFNLFGHFPYSVSRLYILRDDGRRIEVPLSSSGLSHGIEVYYSNFKIDCAEWYLFDQIAIEYYIRSGLREIKKAQVIAPYHHHSIYGTTTTYEALE